MFKPNDRPGETKDLPKAALKPALYDPPLPAKPMNTGVRSGLPPPPPARDYPPATAHNEVVPSASHASPAGGHAAVAAEAGGSKLFIGVNIKLKGVEISDCDVLVIEGQVEATVHSKAMQIDQPGALTGTAVIDVAEIRGEFSGELTARTRLIVHGTGRVAGTIRYGKLVVEEGGELSGDVKRLDAPEAQPHRAPASADARRAAAAATEPVPAHSNAAYPGAARTYSA
ncbi:MAG TPA: polymer-forming cytoskeletal protein [Casimicrobiaceae bacterium]|nr:polymer-forming cytoskeletal protein [Casimicrobiaceae bacterium]